MKLKIVADESELIGIGLRSTRFDDTIYRIGIVQGQFVKYIKGVDGNYSLDEVAGIGIEQLGSEDWVRFMR